jgi:hypothetical protein
VNTFAQIENARRVAASMVKNNQGKRTIEGGLVVRRENRNNFTVEKIS